MMEGISSEAASLAGHLKLDNLCWIYDNNHISIEGKTDITFTEDVAGRFLAYGWNVARVGDATILTESRTRCGMPRAQQADRLSSSLTVILATVHRIVRTRAVCTASRWGRKRSSSRSRRMAGRQTPSFLYPTRCMNTSNPQLGR